MHDGAGFGSVEFQGLGRGHSMVLGVLKVDCSHREPVFEDTQFLYKVSLSVYIGPGSNRAVEAASRQHLIPIIWKHLPSKSPGYKPAMIWW